MSKLAYVFPGQGSQTVGMLAELSEASSLIAETFAEASAALGYDLWEVVQTDAEQLAQTEVTQPALLTASVATYRVMRSAGHAEPDYMAGHSLGEYSALVCAGVITLADAVKLVRARGQYMQSAVPAGTGAMFAIIGLDDQAIQTICRTTAQELGQVVAPVNYNSPGQVVIAGTQEAVAKAGERCKEAGAKRALPLPVSVPSHCELMQPAAEQFADLLASVPFATPKIAVVNNVDVAINNAESDIKHALVRQLYSPVRWTESVEFLAVQGVTEIKEVGPGKVLTGLIKRINKEIVASAVNQSSDIN